MALVACAADKHKNNMVLVSRRRFNARDNKLKGNGIGVGPESYRQLHSWLLR
jgi:hypothetical protein